MLVVPNAGHIDLFGLGVSCPKLMQLMRLHYWAGGPLRCALCPALLALSGGDKLGDPIHGGAEMHYCIPASVPAPRRGPGLLFGILLTSGAEAYGCGGGLLCCLSPVKGNTERQEAPKKIYTCLINVKCSLQTGVTSTSLYNIHRHTIIDTPEYRFVQLGFFGQR